MTDAPDPGAAPGRNAPDALSDEDRFRSAAEPHLDVLHQAAQDDLDYYVDQGLIHENDFTPEEVVGETLLFAWEHRDRRPEDMSLRGWLLGQQHHITRRMVDDVTAYRKDKAISLDEQIPSDARGQSEQARKGQYGWKPEMNITWEDVTPAREPQDIEAPLFTNRDTFTLDPETRHVVMMHDEFDVPLPEVAAIMQYSVERTAALLEQARAHLRQRIDSPPSSESPPPPEVDPEAS